MSESNGNPNLEVQKLGQSFWYDNIQRGIVKSGELKKLIDEYGVLGVTSNPTITTSNLQSWLPATSAPKIYLSNWRLWISAPQQTCWSPSTNKPTV
jgi:hypothetical protein